MPEGTGGTKSFVGALVVVGTLVVVGFSGKLGSSSQGYLSVESLSEDPRSTVLSRVRESGLENPEL